VLDPRLARLAEEAPGRVVGVFVRTWAPPSEAERAALERAGLAVGTVAGTVVTGRVEAGRASRLARLPFVVRVELADSVPVPRPPGGPAGPADGGPDAPGAGGGAAGGQ